MTIDQAITLADSLKPNQYPRAIKIKWLSMLDAQAFGEIFQTHEDSPTESFSGYDGETAQDTPLLIPFPYGDEIYSFFIQSSVDRENGETDKYNQSVTLFNNAYLAFQNYWNRSHAPKPSGGFRF